MLKIRRSPDRPIFNMGIPIPEKDGLYIETGPRCIQHTDGLQWEASMRVLPALSDQQLAMKTDMIPLIWDLYH